jgi:hypothetical protein
MEEFAEEGRGCVLVIKAEDHKLFVDEIGNRTEAVARRFHA